MQPEQSSAVKPLNKHSQVGRLWLYPTVTYTAPMVDASWPTSLPAYFYVFICCAFHSLQLQSSSSWHLPSSSSLHRAKRHAIWAKPTFLDAQICLHYCGNSSQTANLPLLTTHTHTHRSTDITENKQKRSRSIYCNLQCVPSCVALCLTATHKNMKQFVSLRRQGKRNPLRSPASGIYGSKNSPILHINLKQPRQAETESCFKERRQEVLLDTLTLKILTHIYILTPTHSQTWKERGITDMSHG